MTYQYDGYLVGTCVDIRAAHIAKPEGYSTESAEALLQEARSQQVTEKAQEQLPHVILIMNESFSDLRVWGNLELSEDNLPFFNSLTQNTVRGYVNASILGGGTANSEFEVFTGCSTGLLPAGYYPYQQCLTKEMPSMISQMKAAGYTTYSMHPEDSKNWNRNNVYRYLGFDHSLWKEDFPNAETIHYGVSDLATYQKIEELYENRTPGEKLFLFDLTIQNHGGYGGNDVNQNVTSLGVSSAESDTYLSLIKESDNAFEQLIDYFSKVDDKVIICMFGDHQPKFSDDTFYDAICNQTEGLTETDKRLNLYKTPFVIWANYSIPEQDDLDIGMSYLGALLMKTAKIPTSPFFTFLQNYSAEYPSVTINGYTDSDGTFHDWSADGTELNEYRILQYNYLNDSHPVEWGF